MAREQRDGEKWSEEWQWEQTRQKTVYDEENSTLFFDKRRHTDLKTVRRLDPPEPCPQVINGHPVEVVLANINTGIQNIFQDYSEKNCDKNGFVREKNLTEQQIKGMKSVKEKQKNDGAYVSKTDKTGKFAGKNLDNYIERMQTHISEDKIISWKEKEEIEKTLNGHAAQMGRMLRIGQAHPGQQDKIESCLRNKDGMVPPMYGADKDHKEFDPDGPGPPLRPIVAADEAPNTQISSHMTDLLKALAQEKNKTLKIMCPSTEIMLYNINEVNKREDMLDPVIFSTDLSADYTSLDIPVVCAAVAEELLNSELKMTMDMREIALYLAVVFDRQHLQVLGLGDVTHTRLKNNGPKPGITTPEMLNRQDDTVSKFVEPVRQPTEVEQKQMVAMAVEKLMLVSSQNHVYTFNGEIRLQAKGGAMGDSLTGALGSVFMLIWARRLREKMSVNNLTSYMMQVYVDDGNHINEAVPRGAKVVNDEVVIDEDLADTDDRPGDLRTAEVVRDLANNIFEFIKVTIDCPSLNPTGLMP